MLGWDTQEAENVWWMAQNNYWMIQAKVHMSKYGGQPDTPSYIWVWSIVLSQGSEKKKVLIEKKFLKYNH